MADHDHDIRRRGAACCRPARAQRRWVRFPARASSPPRAGHVRLEEVQGREDRGLPGEEPARRSPHQVSQGVRGPDGHRGRLRDGARAAAAAEGGDRVQLRQSELRRHRAFVSRAEAPVRQEQLADRPAADDQRQVDGGTRPRFRRFRQGRPLLRRRARRPRDEPAAQSRSVGRLLQQGAVRRQGPRVSEERSPKCSTPQPSSTIRPKAYRALSAAGSRTRTSPSGRASCWATAAASSTPTASSSPIRPKRSKRRRCTRR